jgi:phosphatidylinositol-3-phosphatase
MRLRSATAAVIVAFAVAGLASCDSGGAASAPVPTHTRVSPGSRVIVVMMENKERGSVIGSRSAPYVNRLARRYASPRNYYGVAHPSLPNYLALLGGSTFGVRSDCTGCNQAASNLVDQLETAGVSWKAYMEGMPRPCFTGARYRRYAKKHNPFAYFESITGDAARCAKVVPASSLKRDLAAGTMPQFAFITPDMCNDTHDCSLAHGDRYLSQLIPPLLGQLGPSGFLVLAWEEGSTNASCCGGLARGGRVPVVIAGPRVRRGTQPATALSHYSTLRTIEDAFGLPHLRNAAGAATRPLDALFTKPPRLR